MAEKSNSISADPGFERAGTKKSGSPEMVLSKGDKVFSGNPGASPGLCLFAAEQLLPRLEAFTREIEGVRAGEDTEDLHRMRVASRRLRAALPLFSPCFSPKRCDRWMREMRQVTRALGAARDADVQLAALKKYRKKVLKTTEKAESDPGQAMNARDAALLEGIRYLLAETRKKREKLQEDLLAALKQYEKHDTAGQIETEIQAYALSPGNVRRKPSMTGIPATAALSIAQCLDALLAYEPCVHDPGSIEEHHAMRIAAKKLRYTMEIYAPVYRRGLARPISQVTKLQQVLGSLHDCDIWIETVTRILSDERGKSSSVKLSCAKDALCPGPVIITGLHTFLRERQKERRALYRSFSSYWDSLGRKGAWRAIRSSILTGVKVGYIPPAGIPEEAAVKAVRSASNVYPAGIPHEEHVTRLAVQLFDSLQSLHALDDRSRLLLTSAALLHDTGMVSGRKDHSERSATMVLSFDRLPFGVTDRGIVAIAVYSHRGRRDPESFGFFPVLCPRDREKAVMLASLLRIANGLDTGHKGTVQSIDCTIGAQEVTCRVSSSGDVTLQKETAGKRADLFTRATGYTFHLV